MARWIARGLLALMKRRSMASSSSGTHGVLAQGRGEGQKDVQEVCLGGEMPTKEKIQGGRIQGGGVKGALHLYPKVFAVSLNRSTPGHHF